jgi:hypothetical protein
MVQQASFIIPSYRSVQKRKLACRTLYNETGLVVDFKEGCSARGIWSEWIKQACLGRHERIRYII